jgi:hypothetical protein
MYTVLYSPVIVIIFTQLKINCLDGTVFPFIANISEAGKSETKRKKQE